MIILRISTSPILHHVNSNQELSVSQLTLFCSFVCCLNWVVHGTRPDVAFSMIDLSKDIKNACEKDLVQVQKVIWYLQNNPLSICYLKLCQYESWSIVIFTDALYANLNDRLSSAGAYVTVLVDSNNSCFLTWHLNKLKHVLRSTLGAEAVSLCNGLKDAIQHHALLKELLNVNNFDLPILAFVDNKNLVESIYSTSLVKNNRLRIDIGVIKEKVKTKVVKSVSWYPGSIHIANPLTKRGAQSNLLKTIRKSGKFDIDGWNFQWLLF